MALTPYPAADFPEVPTAIVTGAASERGIGRATANRLARDGWAVAVLDLDAGASQQVAEQIAAEHGTPTLGLGVDIAHEQAVIEAVARIDAELPQLVGVVNNDGVSSPVPFTEVSTQEWKRVFDVNVHGAINGVKLAAPAMRERGRGHIITIASAASKLAPPGESTYAATKHAIYGYLTGVNAELRGSGVDLSVIMPVVVDTELAKGTATGSAKLLQPADVAEAVLATIFKPRFDVTVPAYIDPLVRVVNVLPRLPREFLLSRMVPNQVEAVSGKSERAEYEKNVTDTNSEGTTK